MGKVKWASILALVLVFVFAACADTDNGADDILIDVNELYADGIAPITDCVGDTDKLNVTGVSKPVKDTYGRHGVVECKLYFDSGHGSYAFTMCEYSDGKLVSGSEDDESVYAERMDGDSVTRCRAFVGSGMYQHLGMVPHYPNLREDENRIEFHIYTEEAGLYKVTCFFRDSIRAGHDATTGEKLYCISFTMYVPEIQDWDLRH